MANKRMDQPLIARVKSASGSKIGFAFSVDSRHAATCTHVVQAALETEDDYDGLLGKSIKLEFLADGFPSCNAIVVAANLPKNPTDSNSKLDADVTILRLETESIETQVPQVHVGPINSGVEFFSFGSNPQEPEGLEITGTTGHLLPNCWQHGQVSENSVGTFSQGHSGSPIFSQREPFMVLGMLVAVKGGKNFTFITGRGLFQAWPTLSNPYKGLEAFQECDSEFFFGRAKTVNHVVQELESKSMVALVAPSGFGKTSIAKAGVLPEVKRRGWQAATIRLGSKPLTSFLRALMSIVSHPEANNLFIECETNAFRSEAALALLQEDLPSPVLIVIDQFEEIFSSRIPADKRLEFLSFLQTLETSAERKSLRCLLVIRTDHFETLQRESSLSSLPTTSVLGLSQDEIRSVIADPAKVLGVEIEESLVERLLSKVERKPELLPLLQLMLEKLWGLQENRRISLSIDQVSSIGEFDSFLGRHADSIYGKLSEVDKSRTKNLLLSLVDISTTATGVRITKSRRTKEEVGPELWRLCERLAARDSRLLIIATDQSDRQPVVELTHETIIQRWPLFEAWISEFNDPGFLDFKRKLASQYETWRAGGRRAEDLSRGSLLENAVEFLKSHKAALLESEIEHIEASKAAAKQAEVRARLWRKALLTAALAGVVGIVILFVLYTQVSVSDTKRARLLELLEAQQQKERADAIFDALTRWQMDMSELAALWRLANFPAETKNEFILQAAGFDPNKSDKTLQKANSIRRAIAGLRQAEAQRYSRLIVGAIGRDTVEPVAMSGLVFASVLDPDNMAAHRLIIDRSAKGLGVGILSTEDLAHYLGSLNEASEPVRREVLDYLLEFQPSCADYQFYGIQFHTSALSGLATQFLDNSQLERLVSRNVSVLSDCLGKEKLNAHAAAVIIEPWLNTMFASKTRELLGPVIAEVGNQFNRGNENELGVLDFIYRLGLSSEGPARGLFVRTLPNLSDRSFAVAFVGSFMSWTKNENALHVDESLVHHLSLAFTGMTHPEEVITVASVISHRSAAIPLPLQKAIAHKLQENLEGFVETRLIADSLQALAGISDAVDLERRKRIIDIVALRVEIENSSYEVGELCRALRRLRWRLTSTQSRNLRNVLISRLERSRNFSEFIVFLQALLDVIRLLEWDDQIALVDFGKRLKLAERYADITPCDKQIIEFASRSFNSLTKSSRPARLDLLFGTLPGPGSLNLQNADFDEAAKTFELLNRLAAVQDVPAIRRCFVTGLETTRSVEQRRLGILAISALDADLIPSDAAKIKLNFLKYPDLNDPIEKLIAQRLASQLGGNAADSFSRWTVIDRYRGLIEDEFFARPPVPPDLLEVDLLNK